MKALQKQQCVQPGVPRMLCLSTPRFIAASRRTCIFRAFHNTNKSSYSTEPRYLFSIAGASLIAPAVLLTSSPAAASAAGAEQAFLSSTGAKGVLADQEQQLYNLRVEKEGQVLREIQQQRQVMEQQGRASQNGQLCATPFGFDIVGITIFLALIGAAVGGITARRRKAEAERLNEQLRRINISLRQQARAAGAAAAQASYPVSSSSSSNGSRPPQQSYTATVTLPQPLLSTASPAAAAAAPAAAAHQTLMSMDEDEMSADQLQCRDTLKAGKRLLKERNGTAAQENFEKALVLSRMLGERVQERRAERGLAASARLQGQYSESIKHLERVLEISREVGEYTGDADAYGSIADCYTEMGNMERAAEFYDKYISHMEDNRL